MSFLSYHRVALRAFASPRASYNSARRALSSSVNVTSQGTLQLDFRALRGAPAKINIISKWQDFCEVSENSRHFDVKEVDDGLCNIAYAHDASCADAPPFFEISVPEIIDIAILGDNVDVTFKNKIMGDINVVCNTGSVVIDKIRGESLNFNCPQADVKVMKLLEGTSSVSCRTFYGKMVNGESVKIHGSEDVKIDAMYGGKSVIESDRNVTIGVAKGHTVVNSKKGAIIMKGIDGNFEVNGESKVELQVNKLAPSTKSSAKSRSSTVSAKVDPEIQCQLFCESNTEATRSSITIVSKNFVSNDQKGEGENVHQVSGLLMSDLKSNKRPDFAVNSKNSGKINLSGAETQSLGGVSKPTTNSTNSNTTSATGNTPLIPSLTLSAKGHIRVESLSWIEAIVRNHGLEDVYQNMSSENIKVGRTASASARAKELLDSKE